MEKNCDHKYKALYYRKQGKKKNYQDWVRLKNYLICVKCLKIAEIK